MLESSWHLFHFISWLTIHWFSSFVMLSACCLMTLMAMLPVLWINVSGIFLILMIYSNYRLFAIAWLKACAITIKYHLTGLSNSEKCVHRESHTVRQTLLCARLLHVQVRVSCLFKTDRVPVVILYSVGVTLVINTFRSWCHSVIVICIYISVNN